MPRRRHTITIALLSVVGVLPILVMAWPQPSTDRTDRATPTTAPTPRARAQLWLMTYVAHAPNVGYVQEEHNAWRRAEGHVAGVIVQSYAWCARDVLTQSRAAFPDMTFLPGLAVDTWLGTRDDGIATSDWENTAGWQKLAADIRAFGSDRVFLDFERLLKAPVAEPPIIRAAFGQLPTDITYWVYPAWGDEATWYRIAGEVLGSHAVGITGSWAYRISPKYAGSEAALQRTRDAFHGHVAPIVYSLTTGKNNWTAAEVWGLCHTLPAQGITDIIWLPDHAMLQVDALSALDALEAHGATAAADQIAGVR